MLPYTSAIEFDPQVAGKSRNLRIVAEYHSKPKDISASRLDHEKGHLEELVIFAGSPPPVALSC